MKSDLVFAKYFSISIFIMLSRLICPRERFAKCESRIRRWKHSLKIFSGVRLREAGFGEN